MHSKVPPKGSFLDEACAGVSLGSGVGWEEGGSLGGANQQPSYSSWADLLWWRSQLGISAGILQRKGIWE